MLVQMEKRKKQKKLCKLKLHLLCGYSELTQHLLDVEL